jgi:hypothetical protein
VAAQKDRVLAQIRHAVADRVPHALGFGTRTGYEEQVGAYECGPARRDLVGNAATMLEASLEQTGIAPPA